MLGSFVETFESQAVKLQSFSVNIVQSIQSIRNGQAEAVNIPAQFYICQN